jgi:sucrose-6-phosphate hydrolase SacC (GH32 family)
MLDYGSFYAPKTAASADGTRRIVFAWLTERWCDIADEYNGGCTRNAPHTLPLVGWDGSQTLPRELSLDAEGQLIIKPVREAVTLRAADGATAVASLHLSASGAATVVTKGRALELWLNATMPAAGSSIAMDVLASPSSRCETTETLRTLIVFSNLSIRNQM